MSRAIRPHLPGVPFHLTARLQGGEPRFVGLERTIVRLIESAAETADGELLAFAVMPNHIHVVYVQGQQRLASFAQPLLLRIALLMRRRRRMSGHVFERRYRDSPCSTAEYLRNTIAYVHLNAVRAGHCATADQYAWTSHQSMCTAAEARAFDRLAWGRARALKLFAPRLHSTPAECRDRYRAFLDWRIRMDEYLATAEEERRHAGPVAPGTTGGDLHWDSCFGAACQAMHEIVPVRPRPDLRDLALYALEDLAPGMPLDLVRSGSRLKAVVKVRRLLIVRALEQGYSGVAIARFLHISGSTVSKHSLRNRA